LQALRDLGKLSEGGKALILGGAGGVGHFAVQIAKALGAKTSATCGPSNIEFVQSLGADHVIDYNSTDYMAGLDRDCPASRLNQENCTRRRSATPTPRRVFGTRMRANFVSEAVVSVR
jgi:NADPH-dependent curcumin reductase CurA